jgi:hypothetical protein
MVDIVALMIPFLFMLAIVYGALDVSGVFRNRRVNAVIALVFALFTLTYAPAVEFINQIMPLAMIFFIVFFFIGFVIKMSGKGLKQGERRDFTLLIIIMGLILLLLATKGAEFIGNFMPGFEEQGNNILVVAGIIFIAVIFLAAYKMSNKE